MKLRVLGRGRAGSGSGQVESGRAGGQKRPRKQAEANSESFSLEIKGRETVSRMEPKLELRQVCFL